MSTNSNTDRETLFRILLDDDTRGLMVIHAAPIRTADDFRRVRAELGHGLSVNGAAGPGAPRR